MVDSIEVAAVPAVDRVRARYGPICDPIPAPGATKYLGCYPQPDRPTASAYGMFCVSRGTDALVHFSPLNKQSGERSEILVGDCAIAPIFNVGG